GVEATSLLADTFQWSPSVGLLNGNTATPTVAPLETTLYTVTVTTSYGCFATESVQVNVNTDFEIPTAFTPDNDNMNDFWNIKELEHFPDCMIKVYNRWGNVIFESSGYAEPWDGSFRGEVLPSGSYY